MAIGLMEVRLVKGKSLRSCCFFGRVEDPYVLIQYEGQEKRSKVAKGCDRNFVWNQTFLFKVENHESSDKNNLVLKIMDKDSVSADDFIGQATIYVNDLLAKGMENGVAKLPPLKYRVVSANQSYRGEVDVAIIFTRKKVGDKFIEGDIGGWKESIYYLP